MKIKLKKIKIDGGFTLVEILVALGIATALGLAVAIFGKDIFFNNVFISNSLNAEQSGRTVVRRWVGEVRAASPGSNGAYTIEKADPNEFIFYTDLDVDGSKERVRYTLLAGSTTLQKGITEPTGQPYIYDLTGEKKSTVATNLLLATGTSIFSYYDRTYTGSSSPLGWPVNIPDVRLIKMTVTIEADKNRAPVPLVFTSQALVRNLKDNL
jgi:type II secretory pathway pseudopilin PulG